MYVYIYIYISNEKLKTFVVSVARFIYLGDAQGVCPVRQSAATDR